MSEDKKFPNLRDILVSDESSSLFGINRSEYEKWKFDLNGEDSSKLTVDMLREAFNKLLEPKPYEPPIRLVSPKQYNVITEMQKEGKLNNMGFPRNIQEAEEYFERLNRV